MDKNKEIDIKELLLNLRKSFASGALQSYELRKIYLEKLLVTIEANEDTLFEGLYKDLKKILRIVQEECPLDSINAKIIHRLDMDKIIDYLKDKPHNFPAWKTAKFKKKVTLNKKFLIIYIFLIIILTK